MNTPSKNDYTQFNKSLVTAGRVLCHLINIHKRDWCAPSLTLCPRCLLIYFIFTLCPRWATQGCTGEAKERGERQQRRRKRACGCMFIPRCRVVLHRLSAPLLALRRRERAHTHSLAFKHTRVLLAVLPSATIYCQVLCTAVLEQQ